MKLIKPPSIMDDIVSQESENFTHKTNNRSNSGKRGRKENTIRIGANLHEQSHHSRDNDNDSVHSHASGKSKGKKTKETTLARPKINQSPKIQKDEDSHSVHSNASKHSQKSTKKENTIMQKPKLEIQKKYQSPVVPSSNSNAPSFKEAWSNFEEESIINQYDRPDKKQASPQQPHWEAKNRKEHKQTKPSNAKFAPFADIEHHGSDDQPVIKLQEPTDLYNKNAIIVGGYRAEEKPKRPEQSRASIEESNVIFGQSKIRESKSRRRNIFDKSIQENASRVTNSIAQSSISGLDNTTRRSNSKRRQIFKNSRQKRDQGSIDNKQSRTDMLKVGQAPLESKEIERSSVQRSNFKPAAHQNDRLVQIPKKVSDQNEDDFSLEQSKSELNLSTSNNLGRGEYRDRDSLIFQFEPEKKKGMTVASKDTKKSVNSIGSSDRQTLRTQELPKIGSTLISKEVSEELKNVQQLLRANDEYLKQNQYLNNNMKKKPSQGPGLFTLDDSDEEADKPIEKPWHQIVTDIKQQQILQIKTVTRNETPLSQAKNEKEKADRLRKQQEQKARRQRQERQRQEQEERQRQAQQERKRIKQLERQKRKQKAKQEEQRRVREQRQQLQRQEQQLRQRQEKRIREKKLKQERKRKLIQEQEAQEQRERVQAQKMQAEIMQRERIAKEKRKAESKKRQEEARLRKQEQQRLRQQQLQRQRIEMREMKLKKKAEQEQIPKITPILSTFSKDQSDNRSEQSNKSSKKANRKKETTLARPKNHKAYVKTQSPRAEESFYDSNASGQESKKEQIPQIPEVKKQEKKPKLLNFSDDEEVKPKAKTDSNFFDHSQSQKSFKPPSSKPPLSKRTNGSVGASSSKEKRPKEKTIAINVKSKPGKSNNVSHPKGQKKLTLMERAMMKHNESNDSGSEASCRDFSSDGSRRSNSSKQSKGSYKKQSTLQINQMIHSKQGKKLIQRHSSNDSSHEEQLQARDRRRQFQQDRERSQQRVRRMKGDVVNQRMIVSKNCTFIDERGRLVQKDLVIKGRDVYGAPGYDCSDQSVLDRMRRSRQEHRKRSSSRDKNKLSRKISRDSSDNGSNEGVSYASSQSFYENSGYYANNTVSNPLREFIRPVEEVPNYNKQQSRNESGYADGKTLNQMFGKKAPNKTTQQNPSMAMTLSGSRSSRRSLGRTEKSNSKRM